MLCQISTTMGAAGGGPRNIYLIEVPDELFMRHMMMYGDFRPAQLSDSEYHSCTLIGLKKSARFVGASAADTDNQRKGKK